MAAASVSMHSFAGSPTGMEDYSLYSNLSDEELIHLAIERSLADVHTTANEEDNLRAPPTQNQTNLAVMQPTVPSTTPQFATTKPPAIPEMEPDPIVKAIRRGDVMAVTEMLNHPEINVLQSNKQGWIPLHEAAYYGQEQCVKVLLEAKPETINVKTIYDQTALFLAVIMQKVACVQRLLEAGANPDIENKEKETPLYRACEKDNVEIVALLLSHGASVNKTVLRGWTAFHETVSRNHMKNCKMLVKAGAKLSQTNVYGLTPFLEAARNGCVEAMRFLIQHGEDINSQANDGATALYEASKCGHEDIVELLLSLKANPNKSGKKGLLSLHVAAQRGFDGIVSKLIPVTSKARIVCSGISPLHLAAEHDRDDILEILIKAGFDVNSMMSEDRSQMYWDHRSTALYFSVINNNIEAATMLLKAGANPNLDIFNPLLVAIRQGCIKMVSLLVEHGANINAYVPNHPTSFPATVMFSMKYLPMLKYLMDNGGDALSCFNCVYGDKPHPPIKTERSNRDELHYPSEDEPPNTCVQFCEMVSTPSISRWAGPIIDVLLDYVGDVKLCTSLNEHLDSYEGWAAIKEKAVPPRPLIHLCRLKIRQQVGIQRLRSIQNLPLPETLVNFLNHKSGAHEDCH